MQSARICIIDDEQEEYLHLIRALGRIGLGCLHIDGTKEEELPGTPLGGLRLVFLDMHLGTAGDANQIAAHTANVFARVVAQDGGPVLVVFWTKHNDYIEAFKLRLFETWNTFLGRLVFARMEKPQVHSDIDPAKLEANVRAQLVEHGPLDLVWDWEQAVHEAASDTTAALANLAAKRAGVLSTDDEPTMSAKIQGAYKFLLRLLLDASAGRNATEESALKDLHSGLAPLHNDRLEHSSAGIRSSSAPLLLKDAKPKPTLGEAVAINSMLHIAPVDGDGAKLGPGSLYTFTDMAVLKTAFGQEWAKVAERAFDADRLTPADLAAVIAQCRGVLVEVSADCDYAQRKRPVARLVLGVLVPSALSEDLGKKRQFLRADFLRHGEDVELQGMEGGWHPVFISHFVFSVSPAVLPAGISPVGRLRSGPLDDLRHWLASHASRPGYLSVR